MEGKLAVTFVEVVLGMASSALVAFAVLGRRIEALVEGASAVAELEMEEHFAVALVVVDLGIEA